MINLSSPLDALRLKAVRLMSVVLWLQVGLVAAVASSLDVPWLVPTACTALVAALAWLSGFGGRAAVLARIVPGIAFMVTISILVAVLSGQKMQVDAHMYYFAALALLVAFCDWRVILAGAVTIVIYHAVLNFILPDLVYSGGGDLTRLVVPGAVVVIQAGALMYIAQAVERMFGVVADRVAEAEDALSAAERNGIAAATAARDAEEIRSASDALRLRTADEDACILAALGTVLQHLAEGDLGSVMPDDLPAKAAALRTDYGIAVTSLGATLAQVSQTSTSIRSTVHALAQAADGLSQRTERQAASLAETAAALDAVMAEARDTSRSANAMRSLVLDTRAEVEHSASVMNEAVSAMSGIEGSAHEIGQIIGVIDEIAFQTNLLALNAGVEAARAGDAGRGFAVVASEVRALAQRSAEAAKEIKSLISASGTQVEQGVAFVGQTGEALARMVLQVKEIDGIVGEISASAQEQATALHQVNAAVNQMDQVTQQNAAMVEESTAASQSLSLQTGELSRLIGQFQVGDGDKVARAAPRPAQAARPSAAPVQAMRTAGRGGAARAPVPATAEDWTEF